MSILSCCRATFVRAFGLTIAWLFGLSVAQGAINLTEVIRNENVPVAGVGHVFTGPILTIDATGSGGNQDGTTVKMLFDGDPDPTDVTKQWRVSPKNANVRYIISDDWKVGYDIVVQSFRLYHCNVDSPLDFSFYGSNTPEDENSWELLVASGALSGSDWSADYMDLVVPDTAQGAYRAYKFVNTNSTGGWCRYAELEIYGDIIPQKTSVLVRGEPEDYGQVSPAYGAVKNVEPGDEIAFSASPVWTDDSELVTARCLGYTVNSMSYDSVGSEDIVTEVESGTECSFTYVHPADAGGSVVWKWQESYRLTVSAPPGCSVSVYTNAVGAANAISADGYVLKGTIVYAVADNPNDSFRRWSLDLGDSAERTISFVMDEPKKIAAHFDFSEDLLSEKVYVGSNHGDWDDAANWSPEGVPTVGDNVLIPEGKRVDCPGGEIHAGAITISDGAALSLYGQTTEANQRIYFAKVSADDNSVNGRRAANLSGERTKPLEVMVLGDVRVFGSGELLVGGHFQQCWNDVTIGGDLQLEGSAKFDVYAGTITENTKAGVTAAMRRGGRVVVSGEMLLGSGTRVRSFCHMGSPESGIVYDGTGAAVFFDLGTLTVAQNAEFISPLGLSPYSTLDIRSLGRPSSDNFGGAGHGGKGGGGASGTAVSGENGGLTYGNEIAPILPGAFARTGYSVGGGVIRIHAREMMLSGIIDASPSTVRFGANYEHGSAAAGSIWITLENEPEVTESGLFRAAGLDGHLPSGFIHNVGGGGGGRIAVEVGLDAEEIAALYVGETPECCETMYPLDAFFPGAVDVSGGQPGRDGDAGEAGTAVYSRKVTGDTITVSVDPAGFAAYGFSPVLGPSAVVREETITASAPAEIFVNAAGTERRVCIGWRLTTSEGTLLASDEGNEAFFRLADYGEHTSFVLTWEFSELQYRVHAQAAGSGSAIGGWGKDGEEVTLTATPAEGKTFHMWLVDSLNTREVLTTPNAVITCHGSGEAIAVFSDAMNALRQKTYVGANNGAWETPENWMPEGVPTIADAVVIPEGKVVNVAERATVGSLTIEDAAGVSVFGNTTAFSASVSSLLVVTQNTPEVGRQAANRLESTVGVGVFCAGDVTIRGTGYLAVGGVFQRRPSIVAVGGNFTVNDTGRFSIHGGPVGEAYGNDIILGGSRMVVCGTAHFGGASTNYFHGHFGVSTEIGKEGTLSASVLDARKVIVEKDAAIIANDGSNAMAQPSFGDVGRCSGNDTNLAGSGHGGKGGSSGSIIGGGTYDYPYAPLLPGRYGRIDSMQNIGGGVVRIITDRLMLSGMLDATATIRNRSGWESGGASGGSVLVIAKSAKIESTAKVYACGGEGKRLNEGNDRVVGGGGGGRISFLVGLDEEDVAGFLRGEETVPRGVKVSDLTDAEELASSKFMGEVDVAGGIGYNGGEDGESGTAYFIQGAPRGTFFILR